MNTPQTNPNLQKDTDQIAHAAQRLQVFCDRLCAARATLPAYMYVHARQAEIVFTRPALPRLCQLFGKEGWNREASGPTHFDWVKRTEEGVRLRISECEEVASSQSEVPAAAVEAATKAA